MDERARFAIEAEHSVFSFAELCRRYHISRPTGYLWLERFRAERFNGLRDRPHRPRTCPHATPQPVVERILALRHRYGWGARKLARLIRDEFPTAPCPDTIHAILRRHDLVEHRKPRRRRTHPAPPPAPSDQPNDVWTADFKGEFKTQDGRYCFPLTVQDGYSRFLLDCFGMLRLDLQATLRRFTQLFHTYGLPKRIRCDNGHPFASTALAHLSQLSVAWIQLGIPPEFIQPGKPQQNGRHERLHRTLGECTAHPPAKNLRSQQRRFHHFRHTYNYVRPHESLGQETPASHYVSSTRPFPKNPPPLHYPPHFELRLVSQIGCIRWKSRSVHVSRLLDNQIVGLEPIAETVCSVFFGPVHLGWLDESDFRIMDVRGHQRRR
jgi:transposase InsO family protein